MLIFRLGLVLSATEVGLLGKVLSVALARGLVLPSPKVRNAYKRARYDWLMIPDRREVYPEAPK